MKSLLKILILIAPLSLNIGCEKSGRIIDSELKQEFVINSEDMLNIKIGVFGDEEGASIYLNPHYAKINQIDRMINSGVIYYRYMPSNKFVGKDSVSLITDTGSVGSLGSGILDTIKIKILVAK